MCTTEDTKIRIRYNYTRYNTQLDRSDSAHHKQRFHVKDSTSRDIRTYMRTYMRTYIHAYMHMFKLEGLRCYHIS
jgi:hypothetical protein